MNDAVDAALASGNDQQVNEIEQRYPRINRRIRLKNPRGPPTASAANDSIENINLPSEVHQSANLTVDHTDNTILIDQTQDQIIKYNSGNKAMLGSQSTNENMLNQFNEHSSCDGGVKPRIGMVNQS